MKQVFSAHQLCEQDGPLGPYIDSYDAEMRGEGYARQTREVQTRLVADFGCWLAKRGIQAQDITAELFRPYLRARARRRRPTRNDLSALQRLLESVEAARGGCGSRRRQRRHRRSDCRVNFVSTCDRNVRSHLQRRRLTRRSSASF